MTSSAENISPSGEMKDLTKILKANVSMLAGLLGLVDQLLEKSSGEEDTVALCSLRQHEQYPVLSGLKRLRAQCVAEIAYHDRLSSGEVPLDPFVKSTNAAHLAALFRFLKLCVPVKLDAIFDDSRVLVGVLQAIHFKQSNEHSAQQKPSWSENDDYNLNLMRRQENGSDECVYASDVEDDSYGEANAFGMAENVLVETEPESERPPLVVDIQAFSAHVWLKAIARNPKSLQRAAKGECEFGEKSVLKYAGEYAEASQMRPIHHRNPFLIFFFEFGLHINGNSEQAFPIVADQLLGAGVLPAVAVEKQGSEKAGAATNMAHLTEAARRVRICSFCRLTLADVFEHLLTAAGAVPLLPSNELGEDIESTTEWLRSRFGESLVTAPCVAPEVGPLHSVDVKHGVNVDVSTLLVLVSNMTNGRCEDALFASNRHRALREQAANERRRPVLSQQLAPFFAKRPNIVLYCCETALNSFCDIVRILAGPYEKARADVLLKKLVILPDVISRRVAALPESVNVKPRAKMIFGFGDAYRLVTMTANAAFVRAALYHAGGVLGHQLAVYLHPSRALSEQKEEMASPEPDQQPAVFSNPKNWVEQLFTGELTKGN